MNRQLRLATASLYLLMTQDLLGCASGVEGQAPELTGDDMDDVEVSSQALSGAVSSNFPVRGSFADPAVDHEFMGVGMIYHLSMRTGALVDRVTMSWYSPTRDDNRFSSSDPVSQATVGGTAGSQQPDQTCAAGYAAVGLRGRSGRRVDALGLICAPIRSSGEPDLQALQYHPYRGGSGGTEFTDVCKPGEWLSGVHVWAAPKTSGTNNIISALQGLCYPAN